MPHYFENVTIFSAGQCYTRCAILFAFTTKGDAMKRSRAALLHSCLVLFLALTGTLLVRAALPAAALNPITEFPLPTPERFPLGITTGPDDNLWFVEYASGM